MEKNDLQTGSKKKSIVRSGLVLSLMTFASRIMGLIREMTKASFLGTGFYSDCFSVAFLIPNLLRKLFAENAISVAFIPTFKSYLEKGNDDESKKSTQEFIASTLTLVSFLTACVVVIGIIITPLLMPIFCKKPADVSAANYAELLQYWLAQKQEITYLTRIMFPYLFLISIAAFFQGVLNGCNIFAPSGFTPVLFNGIVVLVTYVLAPHTANPARAMSIGVICGGTVQALFQWPFIKQTGWKIRLTSLRKTFTNPGTRKVIATLDIMEPNSVCTFSYFVAGAFKDYKTAKNCRSYYATKFVRFLLLQCLSSINISRDKFAFVPLQDFSKAWDDDTLYRKYGLDHDEIDLIESMIKPMELGGDD